MQHHITVLGGDLRQKYLALQLASDGFAVETCRVPELADSASGLRAAVQNAAVLALPMPALTREGWIRAEGKPIALIPVLESLKPGVMIFGGALDAAEEAFAQYDVTICDYTASAALAAANAVPTAEGAIQLAMERLPVTLHESRCLVIGYGRIGAVLSERLLALHAHVTVAARRAESRALAAAHGCRTDRTGLYLDGLQQYDCVFNTVPAPVLNAVHLRALRPDCLIVDLASAPGGLSTDIAPFSEPVYLAAPGLPGKVAPKTAAKLLYEHICSALAAQ